MQSNILDYFGVEYAWTLKIFLILLFFIGLHVALKILFKHLRQSAGARKKPIRHIFYESFELPAFIILWAYATTMILNTTLCDTSAKSALSTINQLRGFFVISVLAWFALRFKKKLQMNVLKNVHDFDKARVDIIGKIASLVIIVLAVIFGMEALGFNMQTLSVIGGISGFSLAFAGKDVIANFFGGFMLYITRPFVVGDLIKSKEKNFEGTVEEISWYYTRIRGSDKQPIYVPNSLFASILVTNLTRMSHWNIEEKIGIRYRDIHVLEPIVEGIKNILRESPDIDQEQPIRVHLDKFANTSLEIAIWACAISTNKDEVIEIKQGLLIKVAKLIASYDADFAYPTTTIEIPEGIRIIS